MTTWEYTVGPGAPTWADIATLLLRDRSLRWTGFDLWFLVADEACDATPYMERTESQGGLEVDSETFAALAPALLQLIDGVIIGWDKEPPRRDTSDVRRVAAIAFEVVDGTGCRFYVRDPRLFAESFGRYPAVRLLSADTPIPAVHAQS